MVTFLKVLLAVLLIHATTSLQRYGLCDFGTSTNSDGSTWTSGNKYYTGEHTISVNCSVTSTIHIRGALKITGIPDSTGTKPAIDGGWDEVPDSDVGVQLFYHFHDANLNSESFTLDNLILTHGYTNSGGGAGVFLSKNGNADHFTLQNCIVTKNRAKFYGGGISAGTAGITKIHNNIISENSCPEGGGGGLNAAIEDNGLNNFVSLTISNCIFSRNTGKDHAGLRVTMIGDTGTILIKDIEVSDNLCTYDYPYSCGLSIEGAGLGKVIMTNSIIARNKIQNGKSRDLYLVPGYIILKYVTVIGHAPPGTGNTYSIDIRTYNDYPESVTLAIVECTFEDSSMNMGNFDLTNDKGIYIRVNMGALLSYPASVTPFNEISAAKSCSYATSGNMCLDVGITGTECADESPSSLGVRCDPDPSYPYITNITSSNCINDNGLYNHLNKCPTTAIVIKFSGQYLIQTGSEQNKIDIGGKTCSPSSWTSTEIICTLPPSDGANHVINVTAANGKSNTQHVAKLFSYSPPTITHISPNPSTSRGDILTTFTGTNFGSESSIISLTINGQSCTNITWISANEIAAITPIGSGGNLPVNIKIGTQDAASSTTFSYKIPSITKVSPTLGGGDLILNGSEFANASITIEIQDIQTNQVTTCPNPIRHSYNNAKCTFTEAGVPGTCLQKNVTLIVSGLRSNSVAICYTAVGSVNIPAPQQVTEGGTYTYIISLTDAPEASDVLVSVASSDAKCMLLQSSFIFTLSNYDSSFEVTVDVEDNYVDEGTDATSFTCTLTHTVTSSDIVYEDANSSPQSFTITAINNDNADVKLQLQKQGGGFEYKLKVVGPLGITEGTNTSYGMVLDTKPTDSVVVYSKITSPRLKTPLKIMLSPSIVTFTINNWDIPQLITLSASGDSIDNDIDIELFEVLYFIQTLDNIFFSKTTNSTVITKVTDDDTAGIVLANNNVIQLEEAGQSQTFTFTGIASKPMENVTITISIVSSLISVNPTSFTISKGHDDWKNINNPIVVKALEGNYGAGTTFNLIIKSNSTDPKYSNQESSKTIVVTSNDVAAGISGFPLDGGFVSEGGIFQYNLKLTTAPEALDVKINIISSNKNCKVMTPLVSFATNNYYIAQTVQISAADDGQFYAKESVSYNCELQHVVDSDDMVYKNLAAISFDLSVTSTGCGLGEFLGAYNRGKDGRKCICSLNYYLPPYSDCLICPDNSNCDDTLGVTLESIVSAKGTWRNSIHSTDFFECNNENYCVGGSAKNETQCFDSHKGPLCEVCKTGYKKQGEVAICQICEGTQNSDSMVVLIESIVFFIYIVILLFLLDISCCNCWICNNKKKENEDNHKEKPEKERKKLTKNNNNPTKHVDFYAKLKIRAARATKRVRQKREEHFVKETILDEAMEEALGDPYNDVIEEINENIQNQVKDQISSRVNSQVDKHMNESISSKRDRVVRQLRIVVGYIQVLSNLDLTFDVPWPKDFQTYFRSFAFINFDMQIIFGTVDVCNLTVPFLDAFYMHMMVLPIFLAILLLAAFTAICIKKTRSLCRKHTKQHKQKNTWNIIFDRATTSFMFMVFLIYPGLTVRIFRVLRCEKLGAKNEFYLSADYSVECMQGRHTIAVMYAIIFVVIYILGIPILLYLLLRHYRKVIAAINYDHNNADEKKVELLETTDKRMLNFNHRIELNKLRKTIQLRKGRSVYFNVPGDFTTSITASKKNNKELVKKIKKVKKKCNCQMLTLPNDDNDKLEILKESIIMKYGSLFEAYEDDVWYWELIEMFRKALLTGGLVLLAPGTSAQVLSGLLVCQFYVIYLNDKKPYKEPADNWLQIFASIQLLLTLLGGLILKMDDPDNGLYEDTFMAYILITLNATVFLIGFCTLVFENALYIGVCRYGFVSSKTFCKKFCKKSSSTKSKVEIRPRNVGSNVSFENTEKRKDIIHNSNDAATKRKTNSSYFPHSKRNNSS